MAAAPTKVIQNAAKGSPESKGVVLEQAANEFVFAVVGHVGSGTSEIAMALKGCFRQRPGVDLTSKYSRPGRLFAHGL